MRTRPVVASRARRIRSRRRKSPTLATTTAYQLSQTKVIEQKIRPSRSRLAKVAGPWETNCGSRLEKKTTILGFPRLLRTPWRYGAHPPTRVGEAADWLDRGRLEIAARSACNPRNTRYAAPAHLKA